MIKREREHSSNIVYTPLHRCHDLLDNLFYIHIIHGIPLHINQINLSNDEQLSLSDGILADEMRLGKTMCIINITIK